MPVTIKELITKNKEAYKQQFYIESVQLSYVLILKGLKQFIREEKIHVSPAVKLNDCLKVLKARYDSNPLFKQKLKKSVYKSIIAFQTDHKELNKALKVQYPEIKLRNTAKAGLYIVTLMHTALIKMRSNQL